MDATTLAEKKPFSERMLDGIEKIGNKVPHPVMMFFYLIFFIGALRHPFPGRQRHRGNRCARSVEAGVTSMRTRGPSPLYRSHGPRFRTVRDRNEDDPGRSLLTVEGIRFIFTSFVKTSPALPSLASLSSLWWARVSPKKPG